MTAPVRMIKLGVLGVGDVPTTSVIATAVALLVIAVPGLVFFTRSEAMALDSL